MIVPIGPVSVTDAGPVRMVPGRPVPAPLSSSERTWRLERSEHPAGLQFGSALLKRRI